MNIFGVAFDLITSNYLLSCGFWFLTLALVTKNRAEWLSLAILSFFLLVNKSIFDHSGDILYYVRGFATTLVAIFLMTRLTVMGFYQGLILILMVIAYLVLSYDVATGENLIYDNYGAVIHGLVFCQLIGVFPAIRNINRITSSVNSANNYNYKNGKSL